MLGIMMETRKWVIFSASAIDNITQPPKAMETRSA